MPRLEAAPSLSHRWRVLGRSLWAAVYRHRHHPSTATLSSAARAHPYTVAEPYFALNAPALAQVRHQDARREEFARGQVGVQGRTRGDCVRPTRGVTLARVRVRLRLRRRRRRRLRLRLRVRVRVRLRRGGSLRSYQPGLPIRSHTNQVFGEGGALAQSGCELAEPHFFFKAGRSPWRPLLWLYLLRLSLHACYLLTLLF